MVTPTQYQFGIEFGLKGGWVTKCDVPQTKDKGT